MSDDFMELGSSGLIPIKDGWLLDSLTGNRIAPDGRVYNTMNELIWDPAVEVDLEEDDDTRQESP